MVLVFGKLRTYTYDNNKWQPDELKWKKGIIRIYTRKHTSTNEVMGDKKTACVHKFVCARERVRVYRREMGKQLISVSSENCACEWCVRMK